LNPFEGLGLGLAAIALATLSTWYVEAPFRKLSVRHSDTKVLGWAGLVLVAVLGAALVVSTFGDRMRSYPAGIAELGRYANLHEDPEFIAASRRDICFINASTKGGFSAFDREKCLGSDGTKPSVLMLGDSLSAHLWAAVAAQLPDSAVLQANTSGCRPLEGPQRFTYCADLWGYMFKDWIPQNPPDTVVLSARLQLEDSTPLVEVIAHLKAQGVGRVIVLGPTVEYRKALVKLLARDLINGTQTAPDLTDPTRWEVDAAMAKAVATTGADYVSILDILCPQRKCRTVLGTVPIAFDYGHYTVQGAAFVAGQLPLQ
jgi:hypothetical protein